jgi:hypothetical protein
LSCQIHEVFGQLANALPDGPPGEQDFVFHKGVLPPPPPLLTTDRIVIRKLLHTYDSWFRADMLWMYLSASTCRELGSFLLACAFHGPGETVSLALHHPDSAIRQIKVRAARLAKDTVPVGLSRQPSRYSTFHRRPANILGLTWSIRAICRRCS